MVLNNVNIEDGVVEREEMREEAIPPQPFINDLHDDDINDSVPVLLLLLRLADGECAGRGGGGSRCASVVISWPSSLCQLGHSF